MFFVLDNNQSHNLVLHESQIWDKYNMNNIKCVNMQPIEALSRPKSSK